MADLAAQVKASGIDVQAHRAGHRVLVRSRPGRRLADRRTSAAPRRSAQGYITRMSPLMVDGDREDPANENSIRTGDPGQHRRQGAGPAARHARTCRWSTAPRPRTPTVIGQVSSQPMSVLLAQALENSDNVLAEALARQVAIARGAPPSFAGRRGRHHRGARGPGASTPSASRSSTAPASPPRTGCRRRCSPRSSRWPSRATPPALRNLLTGLPIAGVSGSLADRFQDDGSRAGAGWVRAKTGSLEVTYALAGYVPDVDGRILVFAFVSNGVGPGTRPALDALAAGLRGCGCCSDRRPTARTLTRRRRRGPSVAGCSTVAGVGADAEDDRPRSTGRRRSGPGSGWRRPARRSPPPRPPAVVADLRAFSARAELAVRDTTGLGHGLPVEDADVVDRPGWVKATAEGMELLAAPLTAQARRDAGGRRAGAWTAQRRPARRSASSSASCPARSSGSSTRWAATRPGPAGCCWSRRTSSRSSARLGADPDRLPAVGVPAREHPPAAVHRSAVAARLLPRSGRRVRRQGRHRPDGDAASAPSRRSTAAGRVPSASAAPGSRASSRPSSAGFRPADGADDAARGARRPRDGRGRPDGGAVGAGDPRLVHRARASAPRARSTGCCGRCSGWT